MLIQRRNFLVGLASALAAPAIVKASSLMPVRVLRPDEIVMHVDQSLILLVRDRYGCVVDAVRDGSRERPFETVQAAVDAAAKCSARGVTVHVGPGDYAELPLDARWLNNLTISGTLGQDGRRLTTLLQAAA